MGFYPGLVATRATSDHETRYFYGSEGTGEVISEARERYTDLPAQEQPSTVVPYDIGYYLDGRYHYTERYSVADVKRGKPPFVVVRTRKYYAVSNPLAAALYGSPDYRRSQIGSYAIYVRVQPRQAATAA